MNFLVICRPVPDADETLFGRLLPDEMAAMRSLKAKGALVQAWSPGQPGAVLLLEAPDLAGATSVAAGLPLAAAGVIATEIIPLYPVDL
jgi:hypothetical protein